MANLNPNTKGLINNSERSPIEHKESSKKGGIASGIARRERKEIKEKMQAYLDLKGEGQKLDNEELMILGLGKKAIKGDVPAFNAIADRVYDKPKQAQDINLSGEIDAVINIGKPVIND